MKPSPVFIHHFSFIIATSIPAAPLPVSLFFLTTFHTDLPAGLLLSRPKLITNCKCILKTGRTKKILQLNHITAGSVKFTKPILPDFHNNFIARICLSTAASRKPCLFVEPPYFMKVLRFHLAIRPGLSFFFPCTNRILFGIAVV